ncbi:Beta-glucosidase (SUN family) [Geosmithia morbida]|uniref:Beta-glucosidase (SUN family) n=1 Tax=Geosmithia morbida TaxID=1094350 RepID=A0A9P4Z104_9HYPO|nr:Beta-glucosidase (SUN family) [Geosmithia morbida]KAF4126713.1 Beta-glucosidase (SUN family) [Geosmithia morbida]
MKISAANAHAMLGWVLAFLSASAEASHSHNHQHVHTAKRYSHDQLETRSTCEFPADADPNLVAVTPESENAGWAMSPDQPCKPGSYCPYACKPGMVMAQWDPDSTYTYPASMNGGVYCDKSGQVSKPFPSKPYCVDGTGAVKAVNKAGSAMSWCQTVLPGNEAMLIPTLVTDEATIAVPDPSYWCSTAAHFYINPPGVGVEGCIWGDESQPLGNWSPYVAGANTDSDGSTFVKLGWNPIYEASSLMSTETKFGVKIECPDGGCNGLPCAIEPASGGHVDSSLSATGAGGADFCVVTVPSGGTAHIIAYTPGGGDEGDDGDEGDEGDDDSSDSSTSSIPESTSTSSSSTSTSSSSTSTTSQESTTTTSSSTTSSTTSSSTSATSTTSTSTTPTTTSTSYSKTSTSASRTSSLSVTSSATWAPSKTSSKTSATPLIKVNPGVFHESSNTTESSDHESSSSDDSDDSSSSGSSSGTSSASADSAESNKGGDDEGAAYRPGVPAIVGLFAAFASAAMLL